MERTNSKILTVVPFSTGSYDALPLTSLAAYSVFWLSEWGIPCTMENLAVLNFKFFPAKFAMVGWPQFPDVSRTNRSVLQMRPKYRNLATSITEKGIFLNPNGLAEAQSLITRLGTPQFADGSSSPHPATIQSERGSAKARTMHPEDLVSAVRSSHLFRLFQQDRWSEAEAIDLINFLGVYDHTPAKEKRRRLSEYKEAALETKDPEVTSFLEKTAEHFRSYLSRS